MSITKNFQLLNFISQCLSGPYLRLGMHDIISASRKWPKFIICFILTLLIGTDVIAQTPSFDQLKSRFDNGEVFAAEFEHTYTDSYTGESDTGSGNIWIDKRGYKLQGEGQTILVDGETSRVYDENRNRVIIDEYFPEDDDFAPSRMLSGIDSTYTVSEEKSGSDTRITLTTHDDFAVFVQVEILIDCEGRPKKITARDISDNEIVTNFTNGRFLQPDPGLFELAYPEDAEIVDMRY